MNKVYRIETLSDLTKIPSERLSACMRDIEYAVELHHVVCGEGLPFGPITWTDDDCHDASIYTPAGDEIISLKVNGREAKES